MQRHANVTRPVGAPVIDANTSSPTIHRMQNAPPMTGTHRTSDERSRPGMLTMSAPMAADIAVRIRSAASNCQSERRSTSVRSPRSPISSTTTANETAATTAQPSRRTLSGSSRRIGGASLASSRIRSSVRTSPLLDSPPEGAVPPVRGYLDVGLAHPEPGRHFLHAELLELEELDDATLM